jgi:hydrogenase/urease accessory protein HupE
MYNSPLFLRFSRGSAATRSCMMALLALLALLSAPELQAHESRPAYLEIEQTAPDQYSMLWRTPVLSGMRLPVAVRLPDDIRTDGEPIEQQLSDSLIERRVLKTGPAGLDGQRIEFAGLQATITDVLVRLQWLDGRQQTTLVRPAQAWLVISSRQSGWGVAGEYTRLGVEHILYGVDHLLFVLTLLLITRGIMPLVKTITAFTVAHSITLGLAALGFVQVPQKPVEAVIALSIVFVAVEIVHARRGVAGITARAPWIVAFTFGLLHGFGFAGALNEIGLPQGHIPLALLFFNIGVEAGQLLFIAVVLGFMAGSRRIYNSPLPRWLELVPSYVIGSVAMLWVLQRAAAL